MVRLGPCGAVSRATTCQKCDSRADRSGESLVWVNLSTKLYYTSTSEFYGANQSGKFITEKDAIAVGYRKEIAN